MELHEALTQISEIRVQMARAGMFRGYRAVTVALTGFLGFAAAGLQQILLPHPEQDFAGYLTLWIATAAICVTLVGAHMLALCRYTHSTLSQEMTWIAVEQLLPALVAGGLLTWVLANFAPKTLWMLPGLWQILFSLGIFASCRFLPRATFWVGMFYLGAGLTCIALAREEAAFSAWAMGVPFGVGQLFAATVLYWTLERSNGET